LRACLPEDEMMANSSTSTPSGRAYIRGRCVGSSNEWLELWLSIGRGGWVSRLTVAAAERKRRSQGGGERGSSCCCSLTNTNLLLQPICQCASGETAAGVAACGTRGMEGPLGGEVYTSPLHWHFGSTRDHGSGCSRSRR
jgi:hypothetical protein